MNISENERHPLHMRAPGGCIPHACADGSGIMPVTCFTRERTVLADFGLTAFNRLRRERLVESRPGGPCRIPQRERTAVRTQLDSQEA